MLAAVGDEDDEQQQAGGAGLQQQQQKPSKVQLGEFWLQAPNAWFAAPEDTPTVCRTTLTRMTLSRKTLN